MGLSFKGGIHPKYNKERTFASPVETMPAPAIVIIPLLQHIGAPCTPLVSVGDKVLMGQKIGDTDAYMSVPVHSPVSGTVKEIKPMWHPSGAKVNSIVIENDFNDTPAEMNVRSEKEIDALTPEEIISIVREAGIVGMGGAGFPLHVKLRTSIDKKVDTIIANGAECEPYITADHRVMVEHPREVIGGLRLIMKCLSLNTAIIAVEDNKPDAYAALTISADDQKIRVVALDTKYPQGGEKQLIRALTDHEIPPGKLPMDIGCAVFNVDTCAEVYHAVCMGRPTYTRTITVSGSAVINPKNLSVRIGTPYSAVFDFCGGFSEEPYKIINGGPMMGTAQHSFEIPVLKPTSALLAFCGDEEAFTRTETCIRCGRCMRACPMRLMPNYIYRAALQGQYDACERLNVIDCIECGCCSYVCPGRLQLVQAIRMAKGQLSKKK